MAGILASSFAGQWISRPEATDRASDKIGQLAVAAGAEKWVPRTLVSQSREEVLAFAQDVGRIIVKPDELDWRPDLRVPILRWPVP